MTTIFRGSRPSLSSPPNGPAPAGPSFVAGVRDIYQRFSHYDVSVVASAVAFRVSQSRVPCDAVFIQSALSNVDTIYVRMDGVLSGVGGAFEISPGQVLTIESESRPISDLLLRMIGQARRTLIDPADVTVLSSGITTATIHVCLAFKSEEGF